MNATITLSAAEVRMLWAVASALEHTEDRMRAAHLAVPVLAIAKRAQAALPKEVAP